MMAMAETARTAETCTVDVELFDSLAEAIAFVADHGGGVVHTEVAGSDRVKGLELPKNVRLEPPRPIAA
jgi:hypothetical protein